MQVLKRQVQSLTMHQKKLEAELQQIEEKFANKKRKFIEASDLFKEEIRKKCATKAVDNNTFQKMVEKALDQLKKEHTFREEQENRNKMEKQQFLESQESLTLEANVSHDQQDSQDVDSEAVSASEDSQEPIDTESNQIENVNDAKELVTDSNSCFASSDASQENDNIETNITDTNIISASIQISDSVESNDLITKEETLVEDKTQ